MSEATQATPPKLDAPAPTKTDTVLRADRIRRVFVDGARTLEILKGVSLELRKGEVSALVGKSGSGKSTLLHLLGLLDMPDEGEILIDNTPAGTLSEKDRAYFRNRSIGFVFQHYFLLPEFNVLENVMMPGQVAYSALEWSSKKREVRERALELLKLVGLNDQQAQPIRTLSGGERQRVAVARALLLQPKILLCDEPTGNLDPETGSHIIKLLFDVSRQQASAALIVTHDLTLANKADRVFRLDRGTLSTEK
ncbi:MAG TPA: ABC transporter ATP-binding protein [Planctomycetota bacterium]|nr:ABC transporter ATP-binding protein [Planctomycetota bacterium]